MKVVVEYCLSFFLLLIVIGCHSDMAPKSETMYLLSLLSYPDPSDDPSLRPSFTNGEEIIPGAKLAVQEINNRTDILTNYKLELIVADDGCNINWKSIISLINNLYYEGKHIVGIIGPQCSDSTKAVTSLTGKSEIALINVHLGSAPELGNSSLYPYSFGIFSPTSIVIDALVALFVRNKWTRAAVLYNPDMLVDYNSFRLFEKKINGKAELSFVSLANPDYLPLVALKSTFVRVIVAFLRGETLGRALCVAYRMGMTYPNYQWLLLGSYPTFPVSFVYNTTKYSCNESESDMKTLLFHSTSYHEYDATRYTQLDMGYAIKTCATNVYCFAIFDAVWAYALALNNSIDALGKIGLTLSNYTLGQEKSTQLIQQQMYLLNFSGVAGDTIRFHNGYISSAITNILNVSYDIVANYTNSNGIRIDPTTVHVFISSSFDETHILVSRPLAGVIIVVDVIGVLLVLGIHVMNTVYRNHKSIKASSSRLNHFAYIGCYFIPLATLLYTVNEAFPVSMQSKSILCNAFPWSLIIGLTLVFGTVTAKTWRLHNIFKSAQNLRSGYNAVMSDTVLAVVIVILVGIVAGFCTAWTVHDPYARNVTRNFLPSGDSLSVIIEEFCSCKYPVQWIASIIVFETIFIVVPLFYLAITTLSIAKKKKEFQTRSILVLVYLLILTTVVGGAIYWIAVIIEAGVNTSYGILASLLTFMAYLCVVIFFTPPVLAVINDLLHPHHQRTASESTVRTLIRTKTAVSQI